ncbi:MAG: hypothetical protein Q9162_001816 [Coniocarpon cinnabarinum]
MPKSAKKKSKHGSTSQPYTAKPASSAATNAIFKMNTDLGQHVLKNPGIASAIIEKTSLKQSDTVLEVGPGTGNLTVRILETVKRCIAVEYDARMAAELTKRVQGTAMQNRLDVMLGDVIKVDLPRFDVCISNTPYQISSPLVFKLLSLPTPPRTCMLMFQREFALRLVARPGDKLYSRLSVNAQMWAKVEHVMKVGKGNFRPPPQVESSVVRLTPKHPRPALSYEEWDGLLRVCFVRKNKTLRASFIGLGTVMEMLERNYRTFCAQTGVVLDDGPVEEMEVDEEEGGFVKEVMDLDVEDGEDVPEFIKEEQKRRKQGKTKRKKRGKVAESVYEKVRRVLEDETKLAEQRARMCEEGDFLRLLYAFNQEGIHFA